MSSQSLKDIKYRNRKATEKEKDRQRGSQNLNISANNSNTPGVNVQEKSKKEIYKQNYSNIKEKNTKNV